MPRISPYTLESAPDATRPLLEEAIALAGGRLLNLHAGMAHSRAVLAAYLGVRTALIHYSTLDPRTGAAIMLAVSDVDGGEYSQAVTTLIAKRAGWTDADAVELRSGKTSDEKLTALLTVARQAAASVGHVDDGAWKAAQEAGWSDGQLVETFAYIAQTLFVDYFNNFVGTQLDVPAAPPSPSLG